MITDLKPYPAYKDSGVEWLGEVPEGWEVRRLKQVARLSYGDSLPAERYVDGAIAVLGSNGRLGTHAVANTRGPTIVVGRKGSFGKLTYSRESVFAIDTTFFVDQRATSENIRWLLRTLSWLRLDQISRDSAVPGLDRTEVYAQYVPVPPLLEQAAIIRFLDNIDSRVQGFISRKQRLIKLLEEKKQAIIHRAVTRGVGLSVPLKSSGIEWLGDVPEHWEIIPLRWITKSRCDGPFGSSLTSAHYVDQGVRVVRLQNISSEGFSDDDSAFISSDHYSTLGDHDVNAGDLLIAGLGDDRRHVGRACVAPRGIEPAMVKADCFRFRLKSELQPEFVARQLSATAHLTAGLARGSTRQRMTLGAISARPVALPPRREQLLISNYLDEVEARIDRAAKAARRQIAFVREYRTRLISDVVTGKLDVREAAEDLPDDSDADDPALDEKLEEVAAG